MLTLVHNKVDKKIQALIANIMYLLILFLPALLFNFASLEKLIKVAEPRKLTAGKCSDTVHEEKVTFFWLR